jgi:hypothetical protein
MKLKLNVGAALVNELERLIGEEIPIPRCSWKGCGRTTMQPTLDGWAILSDWGPHVKDGYYCKEHADALEAVLVEGGFEDGE